MVDRGAHPRYRVVSIAALAVAAALLPMRARAGSTEPGFVAREAEGVVDVDAETRVEIEGIEGEIVVQEEAGRVVRFRSTLLDADASLSPVALFLSEDVMVFRPPADEPAQRRRIVLSVPIGMSARVVTDHTRVALLALGGRIDVRGRTLEVDGRLLSGSVRLTLEGGTAKLDELRSDVEIRGHEVELHASRCDGHVYLDLARSRVEVQASAGALEAVLRESSLVVRNGAGEVDLELTGGSADLDGLSGGAEVLASGTPTKIKRSSGGLHLDTDGSATLEGNRGPLTLSLRGGTANLVSHSGALTVQGSEGQFKGERIQGPVVVRGDQLQVDLAALTETLAVTTSGADLSARGIFGVATVEVTGGSVTLQGAASDLSVRSSGGAVKLTELAGSLNLVANAPEVEVGWSAIPTGKESLVQNDGGDVTVELPAGGEYSVDAESSGGRVESDQPWLTPSDDRSRASGAQGGSGKHKIVVRAGHDIRFVAPGSH